MENKSTFKSKIENLSRSQKTASIIGLVILLAAVGVGIFFFIMGTKNQQNKDNQPNIEQDSSNDQNQTNNEQNGETEDNNGENGGIIIEDGTEEDSNNGENPDDGNQEDEENSVDEEIKDIMDETTEGEEIVELTQTEIDYINNEIFENTEVAYFPNKFLQCYYKTLEEIDLGELFYNGIGFDNQEDVTEEEKQAIIALGVSIDFGGIVKLPEEKVDEVLKKYTGEGIDFLKMN